MSELLVDYKGDKEEIAVVTICREEHLNALSEDLLEELKELLPNIDARVIIITGKGRSFIAGADIKAMKEMSAAQAKEFAALLHNINLTIENDCPPVIAAINGFALGGGCELSMACDLRIASEKAIFSQPEVLLGIIPGAGGTQRLPRLVGLGRAKELIYTGKKIDAQEAYRIGLVNKVVAPDDLMDEALAMAQDIIKNSERAVGMCKTILNNVDDLTKGIGEEIEAFAKCFEKEEPKERITAFLNRKK